MGKQTLAQLIGAEAEQVEPGGFCYCSWPYGCTTEEALLHAQRYELPAPSRVRIKREPGKVAIQIFKSAKLTGKPFVIRLWATA